MRIAIVDDRALAVEAIRRVLAREEHTIAWVARDGEDALRKCTADRPDLILMDMIMPGMSGADATRKIMSVAPCAIVIVTATLSGNFSLVYEALGAGAVDAVSTPTIGLDGSLHGGEPLLAKVAQVAKKLKTAQAGSGTYTPLEMSAIPPTPSLVAIGASTGGPQAISDVLVELQAGFVGAVLIVQHITADFTLGLAEWLQQKSKFPVRLANVGEQPQPGMALMAGRDEHLVMRSDGTLAYTAHPTDTPFRPNVDVFFQSLANYAPRPGVGILLTGMGRDGANGLLSLRKAGWTTFAQEPTTCVVSGMPRAAVKINAATHVLPPNQIGKTVRALVKST